MIDIHSHTTYSDGSSSIEELLEEAQKIGLSLLSITDHNTIQAHFELQNSNIRKKFDGEIISGIEITTTYNGETIEVLGYGFDLEQMQQFLNDNVLTFKEKQLREYELIKNQYKKIGVIFDENNIDIIVHLAAMAGVRPSIEDPILYQEVNGLGTQIILEEAHLHDVMNLVMASSSSVYGNCKEVPFKENIIVDYAISPYAATKKANEVMAHVYHKLYHMNILMLRFFTVYGPKQRPDLAINKFTRLMLNNEEIPMFGDGSTSRDYTYIDDIVDGIIKSCAYATTHNNVYEILNIGSNNPISLKEMIEIIGEELGVKPKIKELPMQPGDVDQTYADISKAKELIGYEPFTSFKEGIKKFIKWYKESE